MKPHISHGIGAARAYVYGDRSTIALLEALGGEIILSLEGRYGAHVEAQIEDSVVVVERFDEPAPDRRRSAVYIYVPDAVAAYQAAVAAGAISVSPPEDKVYGERQGELADGFGNTFYVATYLGSPSPR